jgi:hypothetical protein
VTDVAPDRVVASFDSATVLRAANVAALKGRTFPYLGASRLAGAAVRVGAQLPWRVLRRVYAQIGASEGIRPDQLGRVDLQAVARLLTEDYPRRRYPAVMIGSSNGALLHLAAAMQVPWLPGTVLLPVKRKGDPQRPVDAMRFGQSVAAKLLDRNQEVVLHHMHDQVQDQLMVSRMTYFRIKWRRLPEPYSQFLGAALSPGAPVILVEDESAWPVVRLGERHVFQAGAQGGIDPQGYLHKPHTPAPNDRAPEAEWGADPGFGEAVTSWAVAQGHPLVRVHFQGPQAPAHAVATVLRAWSAERGAAENTLLVPSFALLDPWRTINAGIVPFWAFFSVQRAVQALDDHLARSASYSDVYVLPFQHGVDSEGIATPAAWAATIRRHGATPHFVGLDLDRFPHDIGLLGRYGSALNALPAAREPWSPLEVTAGLAALRYAGISVDGLA